jgi:hypothetical protein
MFEVNFKSSAIHSFTYRGGNLSVAFHSGSAYVYYFVPRKVVDGLMAAKSKGKYYAANIKDQFESDKLEMKAV